MFFDGIEGYEDVDGYAGEVLAAAEHYAVYCECELLVKGNTVSEPIMRVNDVSL